MEQNSTKSGKITVDRFEESFAVCETENRKMVNIPVDMLPENAHEGSIYEILFTELKAEELERRERIEKKARKLWAD